MSGSSDITLEDVETAIKVLNAYYRQHKRAQLALKRIGMLEGQSGAKGFNLENIVDMVMDKQKARTISPEIEASTPDVDLSPEELARIRKIKDEMRGTR